MNNKKLKVSKLLIPCPVCGHDPELWEIEFFGYAFPKYVVKCPKCGEKTIHYPRAMTAVSAWNKQNFAERRPDRDTIDNDRLMDLLGGIVAEAVEDYQRLSAKEYPTYGQKAIMREIEDFIRENPYMLPYEPSYILNKMKEGETRKKQVS